MTDPVRPSQVQTLEEAWRTARDRLIAAEGTFTNAEGALFHDGVEAEGRYHRALAEQDQLFEQAKAALLAVYAAKPRSLSDAVSMLGVIRDEEEAVFEDVDLARAFQSVVELLNELLSLGITSSV